MKIHRFGEEVGKEKGIRGQLRRLSEAQTDLS